MTYGIPNIWKELKSLYDIVNVQRNRYEYLDLNLLKYYMVLHKYVQLAVQIKLREKSLDPQF